MRNLDECTAEVFRRGEKRIKERRRKRSRVLAVCIPVCLIAAVSSAIIFPPMMSAEEAAGHDRFTGEAAGSAPESASCPYTVVEIQDAGLFENEYYEEVTDRLAVAEMFSAVNSLFADANRNASGNLPASEGFLAESFPAENPPADAANGNQAQTESAGTWKGCTITFTAEDGSQAVYRISGNTLVNVTTNETVFLSDSQTAGLLAVLGISE